MEVAPSRPGVLDEDPPSPLTWGGTGSHVVTVLASGLSRDDSGRTSSSSPPGHPGEVRVRSVILDCQSAEGGSSATPPPVGLHLTPSVVWAVGGPNLSSGGGGSVFFTTMFD